MTLMNAQNKHLLLQSSRKLKCELTFYQAASKERKSTVSVSLRETKNNCWQFGRQLSQHPPARELATKARKRDAPFFEISMESALIWWLFSQKPANTNCCSQRTPTLSQIRTASVPDPAWKRRSARVTETYKWLILWGVLLCSPLNAAVSGLSPPSLSKHAIPTVPTCACLAKRAH